MNFLQECLSILPRKEIREVHLPFLINNFTDFNQSIKTKTLEIMIEILLKIHDHECRARIHHFVNEELAKSKSVYDRKLFIIFCKMICPSISKKYFKEVFAFSYLKIIDERKKDIAITFAQNIIEIRKKIDDISSTTKVENTLTNLKSVFFKDTYI